MSRQTWIISLAGAAAVAALVAVAIWSRGTVELASWIAGIGSLVTTLILLIRQGGKAVEAPPPDVIIRRLAATSGTTGSLDLLATTADGAVLHREYEEGGAWGDWTDLAFTGRTAWDIACTTPGHGRTEVFVADDEGTVWTKTRTRAGWSGWSALDGDTRVGPIMTLDAVSGWSGHSEIFAVGGGGRLAHRWIWDGESWSDWYLAEQDHGTDTASCSPTQDRISCFLLDNQGRIWDRSFQDNHWSAWEQHKQPAMLSAGVAVAAVSGSDHHQEIFVIDSSGRLGHRWRWHDDSWSDWFGRPRLPGGAQIKLKDIAAGTTSAGRMEIIAADTGGRLWQHSYRPGPVGWMAWRQVR